MNTPIRARLGRVRTIVIALFAMSLYLAPNPAAGERLTVNFNPDWRFIKADSEGAAAPGFDDSGWAVVSAPHTYNDTDTFDDWSMLGHRGEQNQWSGRTWYRKTFTLPEAARGKRVYIEFEAVRQIGEVYLNGTFLGIHKSGFTPFGFDLTPHLRFDGPNLLAVMVDNRFQRDPTQEEGAATHPNLGQLQAKMNEMVPDNIEDLRGDLIPWNNPHWHPAHGGLYRNVKLHVTDPLHISLPLYSFLKTAGPYAYATNVTSETASIGIDVPIQNHRNSDETAEVQVEVFDQSGRSVLVLKENRRIAAGTGGEVRLSGVLDRPQFWEPNYPHLYRVVCSLRVNGQTIDTSEIPLGIRTFRWDVETGFYINGNHLKLRGWGQKPTDEWPGLGAAQPDWMHYHTLWVMKEAGANFVRWGHCAGGPASIFAGDRLGLLACQPGVDGEADTRGAAWEVRAAAFRDVIIYFRNSPSVLIWEGGNQKISREHARELRGYMDTYDPHGGRSYSHRRADQIVAEFMDVGIGTEGGREIKTLAVVEGEYNREESPRRVWDDFSPPNFGYHEGKGQTYHLNSEQFAVSQVTHFVGKLGPANHAGGANWIFSDSTSGGRVSVEVARTSGEVDGVRLPKEAYYVCQVMFRTEPMVHIIGHWTYPAGTKKPVYVASNCDAVELFVNGKSLGFGSVTNRYLFKFPEVAWAPGEIRAVAYNHGISAAGQVKRTAGDAVALRLTPITGPGGLKADGSDVVLIDVEAVDANGERHPTFQQRIDFEVAGPGVWRGGYNSGKTNSINHTYLDLEAGINRVAVRASRQAGSITVRARGAGLQGSVTVQAAPVQVAGGVAMALPQMPRPALPNVRVIEMVPPGLLPEAAAPAPLDQKPRFTRGFNYSGPTRGVQVMPDVRDARHVYVEGNDYFDGLPEPLRGADYVLAANADRLYSAVDLMEIGVQGGTVVSIAHDDRLPRPAWLVKQFQPTDLRVNVAGQRMTIYQRRVDQDASLTLGANCEDTSVKLGNMYIVFIGPAPAR